MAWEKRARRSYFYRSVRRGQVEKIYYGAGPVGELAAKMDALRRAERRAEKQAINQAEVGLAQLNLASDFHQICQLLTAACLLAAGFHRCSRHQWRAWTHGREYLRKCAA